MVVDPEFILSVKELTTGWLICPYCGTRQAYPGFQERETEMCFECGNEFQVNFSKEVL